MGKIGKKLFLILVIVAVSEFGQFHITLHH
jgi:hypothetical protein